MTSIPPSAAPEPTDPAVTGQRATERDDATAELRVGGMHCGACVALIEESLAERSGVSTASVDLETARAVVRYDPAQVGPDELRTIIAEAGYSATTVS